MKGVVVIKALAYLFKKYQEEAAQVAIDETINFTEKLAPYINPALGVLKEVFVCLYEILPIDPFNCHILQKFVLRYGDIQVKGDSGERTIKHVMS